MPEGADKLAQNMQHFKQLEEELANFAIYSLRSVEEVYREIAASTLFEDVYESYKDCDVDMDILSTALKDFVYYTALGLFTRQYGESAVYSMFTIILFARAADYLGYESGDEIRAEAVQIHEAYGSKSPSGVKALAAIYRDNGGVYDDALNFWSEMPLMAIYACVIDVFAKRAKDIGGTIVSGTI